MENFKRKSGAGFIANIVVIIALLAVVFLSQRAYFVPYGKTVYLWGMGEFNVYWLKLNTWVDKDVYPKISGEVAKGGEVVTKEIVKQKNSLAQRVWESIKNYLAQKFSKFSGTKVE